MGDQVRKSQTIPTRFLNVFYLLLLLLLNCITAFNWKYSIGCNRLQSFVKNRFSSIFSIVTINISCWMKNVVTCEFKHKSATCHKTSNLAPPCLFKKSP